MHSPRVRIEDDDINGKKICRRFEDDILVEESHHEVLPSGKTIAKWFDRNGGIVREMHTYGTLEISLQITYTHPKSWETYFVKRKLATRKKYEQARLAYPDMPAANVEIIDTNAELLSAAREQKRSEAHSANRHTPDPARGKTLDEWCEKLIAETNGVDAYGWFENPKATLGEMNRANGKRLLTALKNLGCDKVFACDIDRTNSPHENTGNLVIELPTDANNRASVFKKIARIAQEQGYSATLDDGQSYIYAKLD